MKRTTSISLLVFFAVLLGPIGILIRTYQHRPTSTDTTENGKKVAQESVFHTIVGLLTGDDATIVPPPTSLQIASAVPGQVALRWTTTDSQIVTGYRVYRDGQFLGVVTATGFGDTDTIAGRTYTYSIIALNSANQSSSSADISVRVTPAVAATPTTPTATKNTNTAVSKNTNAVPPEDDTPTNTPATNQNTNTNTVNTNTTAHTPITYSLHVTQNGVVGSSTMTIVAGDSIQFILDTTNNEVVIRFTPAASASVITLDEEHDRRTVKFTTAGTYTFSSQDDPNVHGTINVTAS